MVPRETSPLFQEKSWDEGEVFLLPSAGVETKKKGGEKMEIIKTAEELEELAGRLGLESQDRLTEGEFAALVETTQGLLGVDLGNVEEDAVTREGLAAANRLLRTRSLGIETIEGPRTTIMLGLAKMAAGKLLEEHREERRWMDIGP